MKAQEKFKDTLIVGVGNILLGDEGIGVHVIKELEKLKLPQNVELMDMGVSIFSLIPYIRGRKKIILIDALKSGSEIGNIYELSIDDIEKDSGKCFSLHQIGIAEILTSFQFEQTPAEIMILGIEIGEIELSMDLSPRIKSKIPHIVNYILNQI